MLVHADHVKVYFKGKEKKANAVRAVDDVSFDIMKGETFGVVGESGCGKSTLGRTLIRLIPATAGHIYLDGGRYFRLKGRSSKADAKESTDHLSGSVSLLKSAAHSSPDFDGTV